MKKLNPRRRFISFSCRQVPVAFKWDFVVQTSLFIHAQHSPWITRSHVNLKSIWWPDAFPDAIGNNEILHILFGFGISKTKTLYEMLVLIECTFFCIRTQIISSEPIEQFDPILTILRYRPTWTFNDDLMNLMKPFKNDNMLGYLRNCIKIR